jgi:alkanesulfonate monooxygenase SsuD/methylene tetrahydromethanopterin reductase-like flavin-dependent oxidoreductase (luciferase family)
VQRSVQLFAWHFMSYPYLPADFDETYESGWITVPNALWDAERSRGLLREYTDQLAQADPLGFDGMVLNEHHQNIYGLMPAPNLIAAALAHRTRRGKIVVLANLLPLHGNPLRVAEEYAMLDNISDGRIVAGFASGAGQETFNYNAPAALQREQFWEAVDLIQAAWTRNGPFAFEGRHYPMRYVNPWPQPTQSPHPPIWVPGSRSRETMREVAKRGFCYFLSSRQHGAEIAKGREQFARVLAEHGSEYHPFRMGILLSVYVAETDEQAREESREGIFYFIKNCFKGHLRQEGRTLTGGPGIPNMTVEDYRQYLLHSTPGAPMLGDVKDWDELHKAQSILVGSPDTVFKAILELVTVAKVGNLLIQFHIGNMKAEHARKSMELFAKHIAPRLREESAKLFARDFPDMERQLGDAPL